jgi:hypothetical protein
MSPGLAKDLTEEREGGMTRTMRGWSREFVALCVAVLGLCGLGPGEAMGAILTHRFDFNGTTVVDSVGTATGVLQGGASLAGGSLVLDGIDDAVLLDQKIVPAGLSAFSVTLRARQDSVQSGGFVEMISQGFSGGPGFYIGHHPSRIFRFGDQFGESVTGVAFPADGAFHFYALTSDGTGTRFYIDSALVFSSPIQENITAGGDNTRFGRQFSPFAEFFHGRLDDARVYAGALTADEVAAIQAELTGLPLPASLLLLVTGLAGIVLTRSSAATRRR